MPITNCEPQIAFTHRGVPVYHIYKDNRVENGAREYIFTLDPTVGECDDGEFDARDLPTYAGAVRFSKDLGGDPIKRAICLAVERGHLEFPDGVTLLPLDYGTGVTSPPAPTDILTTTLLERERGNALAHLLGLTKTHKATPDSESTYELSTGGKTDVGLYRTVKQFIQEAEGVEAT